MREEEESGEEREGRVVALLRAAVTRPLGRGSREGGREGGREAVSPSPCLSVRQRGGGGLSLELDITRARGWPGKRAEKDSKQLRRAFARARAPLRWGKQILDGNGMDSTSNMLFESNILGGLATRLLPPFHPPAAIEPRHRHVAQGRERKLR